MSVAAIKRSFRVVHHLKMAGEARFTDLAALLAPISRTTLSQLLSSLEELGEVERHGRLYRLAPTAAAITGNERTIYSLPPALRTVTHPILERTALDMIHSCALFARVGSSTMKIMDAHNLPDPHWPFTPVGYEWPLVPFHGFAQVFLAHGSEAVARDCYLRWFPYLHEELRAPTYRKFRAHLDKIRRQGYGIEYKQELSTILRVVVPVRISDDTEVRFAVGFVANYIYLIEAKTCLAPLRAAARELAKVLQGKVPLFKFDERVPAQGEPAWAARPAREAAS